MTEACGNAVRHAYGDGDGSVEVAFVVSDDRLEMVVADTGAGLELPLIEQLLETEPKADAEPVDGGMGIAIIRAIVDELEVRSGENGRGTVVHMTKYLSDDRTRLSRRSRPPSATARPAAPGRDRSSRRSFEPCPRGRTTRVSAPRVFPLRTAADEDVRARSNPGTRLRSGQRRVTLDVPLVEGRFSSGAT